MSMKASKSQYTLAGSATTLVAVVFVTVSFCTPYWLISDGLNPGIRKFRRLGLWEVCFDYFFEQYYRYDYEFRGCRWIFDREYRILRSLLQPPFFVAVQVFFTLGFTLLLLACILLLALHICLPTNKTFQVLKAMIALLFASAVCGTIAVIIFGARGDGRDWMPDPDHNYLSWSFALGVIGTFCTYVAAVLFWVDCRRMAHKMKHQEGQQQQQVYSMHVTQTTQQQQTRA